jgi:hypothetical protein
MSLLKSILDSNKSALIISINKGENVNAILNGNHPMSMLDLAISINNETPSEQANSIIAILKAKGAKTHTELMMTPTYPTFSNKPPVKNKLPPLAVKGTARGNIKTLGIAGLPRGGSLRRSRRTTRRRTSRKNRH